MLTDHMLDRVLAGRYVLLSLIGRGGFGNVYLARDSVTATSVAVKVLRPELAGDAGAVRMFSREARLARALDHRSLVRVLDSGTDDGVCFLVMELVRGVTFDQLVRRHGRCSVRQATQLIAEALGGLAAAHAAGIVHRDIKPQNLMLTSAGAVKVMDFGTARDLTSGMATLTAFRIGTPEYMAPEQIRGGSVGPATDLYALGATLFELLCGRPPFEGSSCGQTLTLQLSAIPPRVRDLRQDIPGRLERVVAIALAKEPDRRFRSASAMRAALLASLESPRTTAAGRSAWREPLTAALAIVALLVALHVAFEAPQGDDPDTTVMQDLVEFR